MYKWFRLSLLYVLVYKINTHHQKVSIKSILFKSQFFDKKIPKNTAHFYYAKIMYK